MSKTEIINARIEPRVKRDANKVFKSLGLTTASAITLFLRQVIIDGGLPFEVKVPNKETRRAMRSALAGKSGKRYVSLEAAIRDFK